MNEKILTLLELMVKQSELEGAHLAALGKYLAFNEARNVSIQHGLTWHAPGLWSLKKALKKAHDEHAVFMQRGSELHEQALQSLTPLVENRNAIKKLLEEISTELRAPEPVTT